MVNENKLEVKTTAKGGKFIDLAGMENGDTIIVTKKFDTVSSKEYKSKFGGMYNSYFTKVEYNGEEVYMNPKGGYALNGQYVPVEDVVEAFDKLGGEGTKVKITCVEGIAKVQKKDKEEKVAAVTFNFEKVE